MLSIFFLYSVFLYFFVYCFPFCIQLSLSYFCTVYRPLPPGGNPIAVNKYRIIYRISHHTVIAAALQNVLETHDNCAARSCATIPSLSRRSLVRTSTELFRHVYRMFRKHSTRCKSDVSQCHLPYIYEAMTAHSDNTKETR